MAKNIKFNDGTNVDVEVKERISALVGDFLEIFNPLEERFIIFTDARTEAYYIEIHVLADKIIELSTIDVPLDPEEQSDYRANREMLEGHESYDLMQKDALKGRTFSNIVAEFNTDFDVKHPLKIIGGQHRFNAIKNAFDSESVNSHHGIKVYFGLNNDQRLDVQLISNTNIAVATDLLDRMLETVKGPELRNWCHDTGLLSSNKDFADKKSKNSEITVRMARSFILSYMLGRNDGDKEYSKVNPKPEIAKTGRVDDQWDEIRNLKPSIWKDSKLELAATKYAQLLKSQATYFENRDIRNSENAQKGFNYSVVSAWAYIAGVLESNDVRLNRHFNIVAKSGKDPLNASALAGGKHKTDPDNYRGLGTRTDMKERGRLSELFYFQAEKGDGISTKLVDAAIKLYHAKLAGIEADKARDSLG